MPETKGCMEHNTLPKEEGGCASWCCQRQSPSALYSEFLYSWNYVVNNWEADDIVELVKRSLKNYFSNLPSKGCVFFNKEDKLCMQHEQRCYNCRIYGITPEEEFKPRYERLKVLYQNIPGAFIRDQCGLVETVDGKNVTTQDTNRWWNELKEIEISIGVKENEINDNMGGTYRTYHDHILLEICDDKTMEHLQTARQHATLQEKNEIVNTIITYFKAALKRMTTNAQAKNTDQ